MKRLFTSFASILFLFQLSAQNLIVNPGAESGAPNANGWVAVVDGNNCHFLDGWRHEQNINHFGTANSGSYMFYSGCDNDGHLYQDVDVSGYATAIDAGTAEFTFSAYTRSHDQAGGSTDDNSRIVVEYRDAANTSVLGSFDSGMLSSNTWTQTLDVRNAPVGTRFIRVNLYSYLNTGPSVDGYFDDFSLTTSALLPVELTSFKAYLATGKEVGLTWATASEINNSHFTVERSTDGKNWIKIGQVDGAGNSFERLDYSFIDPAPLNGTSLYRLQQTDFDGTTSYSDIRSVTRRDDLGIKVFPNPASDFLVLEVNEETEAIVEFFNATGKLVLSTQYQGDFRQTFDISTLPKGMYFVKMTATGNPVHSQKITIK